MKKARHILLLLSLVAGVTEQANCQQVLQCSVPSTRPGATEDDFVRPRSAEEIARLKQAPHGAKRLGAHAIEVGWAGGKRILKDKPPYDEPLDGLRWTYCGYNPDLKLHMLLKEDEALFTGALVDDVTGALLPGGQKVLFSKNAQYYLAYEQPDGQDGETIKLYKRNGTLLWKGYNGFLSADGKDVLANFEDTHWDDQGRLQAIARREDGKTQTVTLTEGSAGKWDWLPHVSR
jgi:YD repeat-containing protein